jgi:hypothetical protein
VRLRDLPPEQPLAMEHTIVDCPHCHGHHRYEDLPLCVMRPREVGPVYEYALPPLPIGTVVLSGDTITSATTWTYSTTTWP